MYRILTIMLAFLFLPLVVAAKNSKAPEVAIAIDGVPRASVTTAPNVWGFNNLRPDSYGERVLTIQNLGDAALEIKDGKISRGFTSPDSLPRTIAPRRSARIRIWVDTRSRGIRTGELSFKTNDRDEGVVRIALRGNSFDFPRYGGGQTYFERTGVLSIYTQAGYSYSLEPANGDVSRGTALVVRSFKPNGQQESKLDYDSSIRRIEFLGYRPVFVDNWTPLPVIYR